MHDVTFETDRRPKTSPVTLQIQLEPSPKRAKFPLKTIHINTVAVRQNRKVLRKNLHRPGEIAKRRT
ncbi:hypothetical protein HOLleu_22050 [Holothuria leucospilota]|uniref:Uncharacterized protein n=1 Tax=Holothuria leucospilota TaxID=206669 RepID=A0A9Q1BY82_HOLLE|nr:hypothetical protein HOLleu_22050 [Holothuria leucospilota]